ncbi:hypothetical protein BDB01DRAFT_855533 [Pilobolus umbonatus]|nr:hypothetical protein BDB01DRAFT_855533 [Pilobolus umbonatus]
MSDWNDTHTIHKQHTYCYCGKDRNLLDISIQCKMCLNWFHSHCIQLDNLPDILFTTNYVFQCRQCAPQEHFERTPAGWKDICSTAMANLTLEKMLLDHTRSDWDSRHAEWMRWQGYYFNKKEIIPYVDQHWKSLCTERARTTTWWATLGSCLYSSKDTFRALDEKQRSSASDFRLSDPNLWHIGPQFHVKCVKKRRPSTSSHPDSDSTPPPRSISPPPFVPAVFPSGSSNIDHPFNRFGFKYTPCEPSILPLIGYQQAENSLGGCTISIPDKSSYVSVTKDGLTVTTDKGFRMCRANVGVKEGDWYWEAKIQNASAVSDGPHVRLGFSRREACLNAPVGYDAYGYGYRDKTGDKVFCSRPQPYGEPFSTGDIIGLYISLPKHRAKSVTRRRIPIAYKDHLWFEEKDFRPSKEMEALADPYRKEDTVSTKVLKGSSITIYKNGVSQGEMFTDLFDFEDFNSLPQVIQEKRSKKRKKVNEEDGLWTDDPPVEDDGTLGYYPSVSIFKGAVVTCNFGPQFHYPPQDKHGWKPYCQRYDEYMAEECVWDLLDEVSRSIKKNHL